MNINHIPVGNTDTKPVSYKFETKKGKQAEVHPSKYEEAAVIDTNKDNILSDDEIKVNLRARDILRDPRFAQVDEQKIIRDYKLTLQNKEIEQTPAYHSYEEVTAELKSMAEKYPGIAELQSIGKSSEGRDIWALKISKKPEPDPENQQPPVNPGQDGGNVPDNSQWLISNDQEQAPPQQTPGEQTPPENQQPETPQKPGIVITGEHHAREWITMEVPLFAAKQILENYETDPAMKKRVNNTNIYIVPLVNPDGYEYSRTKSFWWRKNRQPITETACDIQDQGHLSNLPGGVGTSQVKDSDIKGIGIDLNRNYMDEDPANYHIYRPDGDTPCSTWDDDGASDRLSSDTYRGPSGAYAPEVKAMQDFEENNNIKGAIDFHSYGRMILYPWGYKYEDCEKNDEYAAVAQTMSKIIKESDDDGVYYRPMQSSDLYPATGSSEDFQYVNGIMGFTIELGRSFAPDEKDIMPINKRLLGAQLYLIDHIMAKEEQPEVPQNPQVPQNG